MSNLPFPQPGQCWRGSKHCTFTDRARLEDDGRVVFVNKDGTIGGMISLYDAIGYERNGSWHRCPDEPQKPAPCDFGEPWTHYETHLPQDRFGHCLLSPRQWGRSVACANALQGIRNPDAVKGLIEAVRLYANGLAPLRSVLATLAELDKDTTK